MKGVQGCDLHSPVEYEKLFSWVLHDVVAEVTDEIGNSRTTPIFALCRYCDRKFSFIVEEHLQPAAVICSAQHIELKNSCATYIAYLNSTTIGIVFSSF